MNTRAKRALVLGVALSLGGCMAVTRTVVRSVDWVLELALSVTQLGLGIAVVPFDEGRTLRDGFSSTRRTLVSPVRQLARALDSRDRTVRVALTRQGRNTIARSRTEIIDGVPQPTLYDAFRVDPIAVPVGAPVADTPAAQASADAKLRTVFVDETNVTYEVIDDPGQSLSQGEVVPLLPEKPKLEPAQISDDAINFLRRLAESR